MRGSANSTSSGHVALKDCSLSSMDSASVCTPEAVSAWVNDEQHLFCLYRESSFTSQLLGQTGFCGLSFAILLRYTSGIVLLRNARQLSG